MPNILSFNDHVDRALAKGQEVADKAQRCRVAHRRNSDRRSGTRRKDVAHTIQAIDGAMKRMRSMIGKLPYNATTGGRVDALYALSAELQYHRRQLKKMVPR